jgi:hypothetical protein
MNHREIDAKVAECLGWQWSEKRQFWRSTDGKRYNKHHEPLLPFFSTTGDGMLLLIEEAKKGGWSFILTTEEEGYECTVFDFEKVLATFKVFAKDAPLAAALAFLEANGVNISPYLEGVAKE